MKQLFSSSFLDLEFEWFKSMPLMVFMFKLSMLKPDIYTGLGNASNEKLTIISQFGIVPLASIELSQILYHRLCYNLKCI